MAVRRKKGIATAVVVLWTVMAISGSALAAGPIGLDLARWNAVPLTDDAMERVTGEGWTAVAKAVGSFIASTIVSLELERAGVVDWYMEVRDTLDQYINDVVEGMAIVNEYDRQNNPRHPENLPRTCTRCDAYNQYREMMGS